MSRAVVAGKWRKARTSGQWYYTCGGEGCGRRLAKATPAGLITLEPGYAFRFWVETEPVDTPYGPYTEPVGFFEWSNKPKDQYVTRGRLRRYRERLGWSQVQYQHDLRVPRELDPHPKERVPGSGDLGLVVCRECAALNAVSSPPS
jgi:hypothetical protein